MTRLRAAAVALALGLLLAPLPALAIGDIALSSLAQKGKHHELIEALAPEVQAGQAVASFRLMMLAGAYYETGKYQQAGETADLMEQRIRAGDATMFGADLSVYPDIIRAAVALDQGLYGEAIRLADGVLGRLKEGQVFYRSQLIQVGGILGVAQALAGDADGARRSLERIRPVSLFMTNLGPEKYIAMARIQMAVKDFAGALASVNDSAADVSALLTVFYDPTFQTLPRFFIRCKSQLETGRTDEARRGYDELLQHPQIGQYGTLYWIVLHDRARIAVGDGDLDKAVELLKRAVEVIEQRRSSIASEAGRIGFVGDKQAVYGQLVSLLLRQGRAAEAFDFVERAKSRALVDMLAAKTDFAAQGADPEQVRRVLAEIDALDRAVLEKEAASAISAGPGAKLRSLGEARQALAQAAPQLAALVSVGAVPVAELSALLPTGEALLEYYHSGSELHAFVLNGGQVRSVRLDEAGLAQDVQALRAAIEQAEGDAWQAPAGRLHDRLWQPVEPLLGGRQRVLVVAHGALHYLPFAALRAADGKLLADRVGLHFLPSASVLKFLPAAPAGAATALLALGDPDLGDAKLDLKFAGAEAGAVSKLFPDARLLLRKDASETNLRKAGRAFRRLHIASHGSFRADAPLTSGLHLAQDADNDGLLTVGELYGMNLGADLVTLSACETGLGKIASGDDIVGLARGFLYAGARSIVASLWSVDDQATAQLMQAFYRNLATLDKLEALRQAQLATRHSFPHPFFWAAFQLTGKAD